MSLLLGDRTWKSIQFFGALCVFMFCLAACSTGEPETAVSAADLDLDDVCSAALNLTFESEESIFLGEAQGGLYYAPAMVSFLNDGRVLWRYTIEPVIGTFECEAGIFTAEFLEGETRSFRGEFDPDELIFTMDGMKFYPSTEP